jgi:hypothetical protein
VTFDALLLLTVARQVKEWRRLVVGGAIVLCAVSLYSNQIFSWKSLAELPVLVVALAWSWRTSPHLQNAIKVQIHSALSPTSEFGRRVYWKWWRNRDSSEEQSTHRFPEEDAKKAVEQGER